jgi:hypothetical protein
MPAEDLRSYETKYLDDEVDRALERQRDRFIEVIANWANDEGISYDATERLSLALGLDYMSEGEPPRFQAPHLRVGVAPG